MDIESSIILLIMFALCAIPIVIINKKKKLKEKLLLQTLFDLAAKSNCKITTYDKWSETVIGIDKPAHKLFFVRKTTEEVITREIILSEIQKCRFINTNRVVNGNRISQKVIDKLELVFTFYDSKKSDLILEFYNAVYDSLFLRDEIPLAEKWSEIVNSELAILASGK